MQGWTSWAGANDRGVLTVKGAESLRNGIFDALVARGSGHQLTKGTRLFLSDIHGSTPSPTKSSLYIHPRDSRAPDKTYTNREVRGEGLVINPTS